MGGGGERERKRETTSHEKNTNFGISLLGFDPSTILLGDLGMVFSYSEL